MLLSDSSIIITVISYGSASEGDRICKIDNLLTSRMALPQEIERRLPICLSIPKLFVYLYVW